MVRGRDGVWRWPVGAILPHFREHLPIKGGSAQDCAQREAHPPPRISFPRVHVPLSSNISQTPPSLLLPGAAARLTSAYILPVCWCAPLRCGVLRWAVAGAFKPGEVRLVRPAEHRAERLAEGSAEWLGEAGVHGLRGAFPTLGRGGARQRRAPVWLGQLEGPPPAYSGPITSTFGCIRHVVPGRCSRHVPGARPECEEG